MLIALCAALALADLPTITISRPGTELTQSCRVVIPPGTVLADAEGSGAILIRTPGIRVEFAPGSALRGAPAETPWDSLSGLGIRIENAPGVSLVNAAVRGYKVGLWALNSDGLSIEGGDYSDNFRQRLRSTPAAEFGGDWLWPHRNDSHEWARNYGAAIYIERTSRPTIRDVFIRRGQNGIILDRVSGARVFDNDCSFLSGWGLALWRTTDSTISRNAFDFCIRGYSHGVYNRGQDSAGILAFEQCSRNTFIENSATHGGDGFFGFAGREALGEAPPPEPDFDYARQGCNDNLFIRNDLSFAAAHGLELTFSHGNTIALNRFLGNAICGIWGGYSRDTLVVANHFEANGDAGYGPERGGINIEHGSGNRIIANTFLNNAVGVHLWWDNDEALLKAPGVRAGYRGVAGNIISGNSFTGDAIALRLRDDGVGPNAARLPEAERRVHVTGTVWSSTNRVEGVPIGVEKPDAVELLDEPADDGASIELPEALGGSSPVGARAHLAGRHNIVMDEWGPWDHETPLVRLRGAEGAAHIYEAFGIGADELSASAGALAFVNVAPSLGHALPAQVVVRPVNPRAGVTPYLLRISGPDLQRSFRGVIIAAEWSLVTFPWTKETDPRENLDGWRALARGETAMRAVVGAIRFPFGGGGPRNMKWSDEITARGPGPNHFGLIATTHLVLPKGRWKFTTLSDDGVRVSVNGAPVIENWTWHAPTRDQGLFIQPADGEVEIVVEYFEIDGHAVLELEIEPAE